MNQYDIQRIADCFAKQVCPGGTPTETSPMRFVRLASRYPQLAADTFLLPGVRGRLVEVTRERIGVANQLFLHTETDGRSKMYETLIETALNLSGFEARRVGFPPNDIDAALGIICSTLALWEFDGARDDPVARETVERMLHEMRQVLLGKSMVAKLADQIEQDMVPGDVVTISFIQGARKALRENVYHEMRERDMVKLGNDSATGLRWVRHMDFVQVSSNPVIAARAYEDFPELWDVFREVAKSFPEWKKHPETHKDEMAMLATINSMLPNILVFRPIALLSDFQDGLVSYQLNPLKATSFEGSVEDAETISAILREVLLKYDEWLGWDSRKTKGRPNIVFKVASCAPIARQITTGLNRRGIGTNNTVTYSVSQEISLMLAAAEGMAAALKKGIPISQVYETNMIGRLEDWLRQSEALRLIRILPRETARNLAQELCGKREASGEDMVSKKNLATLIDPRFVKSLANQYGEVAERLLAELEEDIQYSGIYVTRRVWQLFFSNDVRPKWVRYFKDHFGLTQGQAEEVMSKIDLLPASKRRARDTYLVLGTPNVTNTDFPDQQLKVWQESQSDGFDLSQIEQSIREEPDPSRLSRLLRVEDFCRVWELTSELQRKLKEVGVSDSQKGTAGLKPSEWSGYGAVRATMEEFESAYIVFRQKVADFVLNNS